MNFSNSATGTLYIRSGTDTAKHYTIQGVTSQIISTEQAQTQVNKLFAVAGLSVVGDKTTTFTMKKVVVE